MNKKQAIEQIGSLFENAFNREAYTHFLRNLLNDIEPRDNHYSGNTVPDAYKSHINQYWRIGKYLSPENVEVDLYIVEVPTLAKLDRARTALRNFTVRTLKTFGEKDHALIAFYAKEDGGADWRFSYVKIEHSAKMVDGKAKIENELTPAKRFSFLVGEHENSHTAQAQLVDLLVMDYANPKVEELETAFSIEKVTKEFFEQYRELFLKLSDVLAQDTHFKAEFDGKKQKQLVAKFAKKLLGQIVFLYFLQKKGWMGVPEGSDWGKGDRSFLQGLFAAADEAGKNYYLEKLQYLFYEALANDRKDQFDPTYYQRFGCRIPFLNGGLFEADYDWQKVAIGIPNSIFSNKEKTKAGDKGTGILDVFNRYNFTIKEDEPLDKEVAIDPEMLGKVFENMLEITERKSKGAYYTPREIVHYMCQESLIHYLEGEVGKDTKPNVPIADIATLVLKGSFAVENDQRILEKGKETQAYAFKLPDSIRANAATIDKALADIRVCDPAIGSGAFLVGMLHEIVHSRQALAPHLKVGKRQRPYDLKKHTIGHSLYGVDLDPSAIDIARLRLWLSLVVDEDDYTVIDALPNLDYKIMQGNSLIEEFEGVKLFDETFIQEADDPTEKIVALQQEESEISREYISLSQQSKLSKDQKRAFDRRLKEIQKLLNTLKYPSKKRAKEPGLFDLVSNAQKRATELEELHTRFFAVSSPAKKRQLRNQISELEWSLIEATLKEQYKADALSKLVNYRDSGEKPWFLWKLNFSEVFKHRGGFDVVIANPPYIDSESMARLNMTKMREELKGKLKLARGNWDIYIAFFEQALLLSRVNACVFFITPDKWLSKPFGTALRTFIHDKLIVLVEAGRKVFEEAKVDAIITGVNNGPVSSFVTGVFQEGTVHSKGSVQPNELSEPYALDFLFSPYLDMLRRIEQNGSRLAEFAECENACATSDAYKLKEILKDGGIGFEASGKQLMVVNTGTTGKYANQWGRTPMTYLKDKYLSPYVETEDFFSLFTGTYSQRAVTPKLIVKGLTLLDASIDSSGRIVPGKSTLIVKSKRMSNLFFLHLVLNSDLPFFYIKEKYRGSSYNQGINFTKHMLNDLPLPALHELFGASINKLLSDYMVQLQGSDIREELILHFFSDLVNGLIYELYFPDEIKAGGKEIFSLLGKLSPLTDDMNDTERMAVIHHEFERLYDPHHPVRNHLETLDSIKEVRVIKEALKR